MKRYRRASDVVFLTFTYDPSKFSLIDAWKDVKRRYKEVIKYFRKRYGVICAVGATEAQESLYPAPHMIILLRKPAETFVDDECKKCKKRKEMCKKCKKRKKLCGKCEKKGKKVIRFVDKKERRKEKDEKGNEIERESWEEALGKEGFIDAFAPRSVEDVHNYLRKYMEKVKKLLFETEDPGELLEKPKALSVFLCRLFRIPLIYIYPRGFDKKVLKGKEPKRFEEPLRERVHFAEAVWRFIYRKPIDGVSPESIRYWDYAQKRINELYAQYCRIKYGCEPSKGDLDSMVDVRRHCFSC